jgi:hypothetical protein
VGFLGLPRTTVFTKAVTASSDVPFRVLTPGGDDTEVILSSINLHCYTNDLYYGNGAYQSGIIRANACVWFDGTVKLSDFWFKNVTAGSNGQIVIVGIVK